MWPVEAGSGLLADLAGVGRTPFWHEGLSPERGEVRSLACCGWFGVLVVRPVSGVLLRFAWGGIVATSVGLPTGAVVHSDD